MTQILISSAEKQYYMCSFAKLMFAGENKLLSSAKHN